MRRWLNAFAAMPPTEKNQLIIAVSAILIALYVPLVYLRSASSLEFAESMVARASNRMKIRHIDVKPPTVSVVAVEREIAGIRREVENNRAALAQYRERFAPIMSNDEQQTIKLDISQLAQDNEVAVDSLVFDPPERNSQFNRPIISFQAHGSFQASQAFLRGLSRLSRSVTVVRFSMEAATPKSGAKKDDPPQPPSAIGVRLDLQLAI